MLGLSTLRLALYGGAAAIVIAFCVWDYHALTSRAQAVADLQQQVKDDQGKIEDARRAAQESADTLSKVQAQDANGIAALKSQRDQATHDAALNATIKEKIKNAPSSTCAGPAMRAFIDSLRTEQLNSDGSHGSAAGPAPAVGD